MVPTFTLPLLGSPGSFKDFGVYLIKPDSRPVGVDLDGAEPLVFLAAAPAAAQEDVRTQAEGIITLARGATAIVTRPDSIARVSIADPNVADVVLFPGVPNQMLVNAINVGTTSLVVWGRFGQPRMFTVEVTADIASLRDEVDTLLREKIKPAAVVS